MRVLESLEPKKVFYYFEEISRIPHVSYHEQQLSAYCASFAKERGLEHYRDEMGNLVIVKEATAGYEDVPPIMIQGHLDMVGDQTAACTIDMEKEPIVLQTEDDFVTADGTTLGGDDGIAVAYALALLDSNDISHPRLEVILTVSEEVGLLGADAIDLSMCQARRLINIDSEEEGVITAGCAGGVRTYSHIPVVREEKTGLVYEVTIQGLLGGHSGINIHEGRANANLLMGRMLMHLQKETEVVLCSVCGGAKDNVIAKSAKAVVIIKEEDEEKLIEQIRWFACAIRQEYGVTDPDIEIVAKPLGIQTVQVLDSVSNDRVITALGVMPNGVQTMSADIPGLVETSLNMGVMELREEEFVLDFAIRSSVTTAKEMLVDKVKRIVKMLGGTTELQGDYPSWPYERRSDFRDLCVNIYEEMYGKKPVIDIIHAGLECGLLSAKIPGLQCISIGPDMQDVHTPNEKLRISSTARVWEYIKRVLAAK